MSARAFSGSEEWFKSDFGTGTRERGLRLAVGHRAQWSAAMSNLNLEPKHNQAVRQEIGERLRLLLSEGREEVPRRLRELVHSFGYDGEPPLRHARSPEKTPSLERVGGRKSLGAWLVRRGARWG